MPEKAEEVLGKRTRVKPAKLLDTVEEPPKASPKSKKAATPAAGSAKKAGKKVAKQAEEVEESLENIEKELAKPAAEVEKSKGKKEPAKSTPKKGAKMGPRFLGPFFNAIDLPPRTSLKNDVALIKLPTAATFSGRWWSCETFMQ